MEKIVDIAKIKKIKEEIFDHGGFVSVRNIPEGRLWFNNMDDKFRDGHEKGIEWSFDELFVMSSDHRETLKKLFGKPSFYFKGEFYYHNYLFEYKEHLFLIGTAKDKGTLYEVHKVKNKKLQGVVSGFLTEIHSLFLTQINNKREK